MYIVFILQFHVCQKNVEHFDITAYKVSIVALYKTQDICKGLYIHLYFCSKCINCSIKKSYHINYNFLDISPFMVKFPKKFYPISLDGIDIKFNRWDIFKSKLPHINVFRHLLCMSMLRIYNHKMKNNFCQPSNKTFYKTKMW